MYWLCFFGSAAVETKADDNKFMDSSLSPVGISKKKRIWSAWRRLLSLRCGYMKSFPGLPLYILNFDEPAIREFKNFIHQFSWLLVTL